MKAKEIIKKQLGSVLLGILMFGGIVYGLTVTQNIDNAVAYIKKMIFTTDGTENGEKKVVIDGEQGKISVKGDVQVTNNITTKDLSVSNSTSTNDLTVSNNASVNGKIGIGTTNPSYKLHTKGDIYADGGWLRTNGARGWYNQSYGGGMYMQDSTWVRTYNNKAIYANNVIRADGGFQVDGEQVIASDKSRHRAKSTNNSHYGYFEVRRGDGKRGAYFGRGDGNGTVNLNLDNASTLSINKNLSVGGNIYMSNKKIATESWVDNKIPKCKTGEVLTSTDGINFKCVEGGGGGGNNCLSLTKFAPKMQSCIADGIMKTKDGYYVVDSAMVGGGCNNSLIIDKSKCIVKIGDFYVAPDDSEGYICFYTAVDHCNNLSIGGNTDWYLPSLSYLKDIYNNRAKVYGLETPFYYSSTSEQQGYIGLVDFRDGTVRWTLPDHSEYVRCISK